MSRTPYRLTLALAAAGLFLAAASPSPAQTLLRWKFHEGEVLDQSVEQVMKMTMKLGEQDISSNVTQTMDYVWTVGEVAPDGSAQVTQAATRVRMKMEGMSGFEYDSASEEEPTGVGAMLAPALGALAKSKATMTMTPRGELNDVKVSEETIEAMKKLPMAGQMSGMFSEEGLVDMIKQGSQVLPEEPVKKGDTWTGSSEIDMPPLGKMTTQTTYTYAGPEQVDGKTLQRIDLSIAMKLTPSEQEGQPKVAVKDQKADGVLYFNNEAGRLSHSKVNQKMTLEVNVTGNSIQQNADQTTTVRMTPAEEKPAAEKQEPAEKQPAAEK